MTTIHTLARAAAGVGVTNIQPPLAARLRQCPGGPLLVRGAETVVDDDGRVFPVNRPVVAVCVCGASQRRPWCDGTHKVLQPRPAASGQ